MKLMRRLPQATHQLSSSRIFIKKSAENDIKTNQNKTRRPKHYFQLPKGQ
jgi:hypothetical protein